MSRCVVDAKCQLGCASVGFLYFYFFVFVLIAFYVSRCRKLNGRLLARRRFRCVRRRDNCASFTAADVVH